MKKINIAEILKDCPKGMELNCTMYDDVEFMEVDTESDTIILRVGNKFIRRLNKYGQDDNVDYAKCVIFPKGKTTWEGFQRPFKDGDVLYAIDEGEKYIFILEKIDADGRVYCYLNLREDNLRIQNVWLTDINESHRFATEQEKEKLFDAIKENGYKWNAETKTLEKLIAPKFKVGDKVLWNCDTETPRTITKVKFTSERSYLYWIDCKGCSSGWYDETELIPITNKFDISTLKPFDKVLVRAYNSFWRIGFFEKIEKKNKRYPFVCMGYNKYSQCIPFEGNEHLLDTTNDCDEYYKTWE